MVWSLLLLLFSGCSGIEPYTPTNQREEGPESGLFSGPEGGFVLYRKSDEAMIENQEKVRIEEVEPTGPQDND